jgi:hypothetical protein
VGGDRDGFGTAAARAPYEGMVIWRDRMITEEGFVR